MYKYSLKQENITEYKADFDAYIKSCNDTERTLNRKQVIQFLRKLGLEIKMDRLFVFNEHLFKNQDKNRYDCSEVITLIGRLSVSEEVQMEFKQVFSFFDRNRCGIITAEDLKKGVQKLQKSIKSREIEDIFRDLDDDGDSLVNFEDFIAVMISK